MEELTCLYNVFRHKESNMMHLLLNDSGEEVTYQDIASGHVFYSFSADFYQERERILHG